MIEVSRSFSTANNQEINGGGGVREKKRGISDSTVISRDFRAAGWRLVSSPPRSVSSRVHLHRRQNGYLLPSYRLRDQKETEARKRQERDGVDSLGESFREESRGEGDEKKRERGKARKKKPKNLL